LELQLGGEGERSDLVAASQGALARASQLVSDAAAMRKREAIAAFDSVDKEIYRHLSLRFESLLPQNVVGLEVSAIKGELLASKIISRSSKSLSSISASLTNLIRPSLPAIDEPDAGTEPIADGLQAELRQRVISTVYQAEFAQTVIEASSKIMRYLAASQWPDLLSEDASAELGSIVCHSVAELDFTLGEILKSIKEEGGLVPERIDVGALRQTINNTLQSL
jgi:hypothetical protein